MKGIRLEPARGLLDNFTHTELSRLVIVVSEAQRDAIIEVSLVCRLCAGLGIAVWAACQTLASCRRLDG